MRTILLCALLAGCAASRPPAGTPVVDLADLDPAAAPSRDVVFRVPAGTRLPVSVDVATPFARTDGGAAAFHLVFEKTVYWYPRSPRSFSFDGKTWQRPSGEVSFSVSRTRDTGPAAHFRLRMR